MNTSPIFYRNRPRARTVLHLLSALVCAASASAGNLIWDPLANGGTTAASGNWDTTAGNLFWYNGSSDVLWAQTSGTAATMGATFNGPDAAAGTYAVSLDASQIALTNLIINNSGYAFSGANAIYVGTSDVLTIAAGKTATFSCGLQGSGTSPYWLLGSGATMNIPGNISSSQQIRLTGAPDSAYNLSGINNPAIMYILAPVNLTGGSLVPSSSFYIGYTQTPPAPYNASAYSSGILTVSGSSTLMTINGNILIIGRANGSGTLVVSNGTVNVGISTTARNLGINYDGSANSSGTVNLYGGTLNVGASSQTGSQINFYETAASATAASVMNLSGGTVNAWGGILFGAASGTFTGGSAVLTQTGGTMYIGSKGITRGANYTTANNDNATITLSGGTVGALANWASTMPITLATTNGNLTFQCADNNNSPYTISLSGALTGAGGLNVTGSGTLSLSGANNYAGTTTVSNGTLAIVTGATPILNGPVTLDGSAGLPTASVTVSNPGQYWTNNGSLTCVNAGAGTPTLGFQFGSLSPSSTVAPIQIAGGVAFTTSPNVVVGGTAIAVGTYPLVKYTAAVSGTVPVNLSLPAGAAGYVTNLTASKTIALVVTSSSYNPALYWAVGNGVWDINTSSDWKQFGSAAKYTDGNAVVLDDSATGSSPINLTLNTTVNPLSVTANNAAKSYVISGSGSIAGSASLSLVGAGTVTLAGTNTYGGGTILSAGQLNINNGGNASGTAIGTGTLTINAGAAIDNTSGADITLQASIPQIWNGNFTYQGSANNLNTGSGYVVMNNPITISNHAGNLTIGGSISDNGAGYQLSKTGPGALTLPVANGFIGGMALYSGLLNLGDPNAAGQGVFTINGGAIDNVSGAELPLTPLSAVWAGSFTFAGTTNLDFDCNVSIPNGLGSLTLNVASNTLMTFGDVVNNNTTVIKTGAGTWEIAGNSTSAESLGLVVAAGQVNLHKSGQAIVGGNSAGLTVETNGVVLDEGGFQIHSGSPAAIPVNLQGGVWDLNGFNENVDKLSISAGGTLRMGASGGTSTLRLISGFTAQLAGTDCQLDAATNGTLIFNGPIGGTGSLVKIGAGTLNLSSNNTYSGSTVISNGTLALVGVGSISNTAGINLATANSSLDLSGSTDTNSVATPELTLLSGQSLSGFGSVTGLVATLNGALLAPGSATAVGTLTVTGIAGANVLGGTTLMKLDKGNATNDQLSVSGSLVLGGNLTLTNLSGSLANGDSFTLFHSGAGTSGMFTSISPSRPGYPAFGLAWNTNNLAASGTLSVITAAIPNPPKIIGVSASGSTLTIQGANGLPNEPFVLLTSADVTAPLANWTPVLTNAFDGSGSFNVSAGMTNTQQFFALWMK